MNEAKQVNINTNKVIESRNNTRNKTEKQTWKNQLNISNKQNKELRKTKHAKNSGGLKNGNVKRVYITSTQK